VKRTGYKKAQSVLEYVIILTVVVGAILFAAKTQLGFKDRDNLDDTKGIGALMKGVKTQVESKATDIANLVK